LEWKDSLEMSAIWGHWRRNVYSWLFSQIQRFFFFFSNQQFELVDRNYLFEMKIFNNNHTTLMSDHTFELHLWCFSKNLFTGHGVRLHWLRWPLFHVLSREDKRRNAIISFPPISGRLSVRGAWTLYTWKTDYIFHSPFVQSLSPSLLHWRVEDPSLHHTLGVLNEYERRILVDQLPGWIKKKYAFHYYTECIIPTLHDTRSQDSHKR
jgi:hypothetical protein